MTRRTFLSAALVDKLLSGKIKIIIQDMSRDKIPPLLVCRSLENAAAFGLSAFESHMRRYQEEYRSAAKQYQETEAIYLFNVGFNSAGQLVPKRP